MDKAISLADVFITLKKRWKLIFLITLAVTLISGAISFFVLKPVYQASTQILVNQKSSENRLDITALQSNVDLINTYSVIIKSPVILEKVINKLDLNLSVEQLNKNISVSSQENSQVFSLTVEDGSHSKAVEIANTISTIFQEEIQNIMNVDNVSILAVAEIKEKPIPIKPNPKLNITIGVLVGLMAGLGLSFVLEFLDNTLKKEEDIGEILGMPVLGSIPKMSKSNSKGRKRSKKQKFRSDTVA
ncbi:YveK family protein [Neobacillus jeddahensis]|uniref:YveK family protein n=1 Tax=Neobacillus jeddahensis TaxID=1461580 RepID=UPI00058D53D6|nr:Wzz/FepE/Etk N-terminal domain-containing protein [Neobacillus jeddahensis]